MLFFSLLLSCNSEKSSNNVSTDTSVNEVIPQLDLVPGENSFVLQQDISGIPTERKFHIKVPRDFTADSSYSVLFSFHGRNRNCVNPDGPGEGDPAKDMMEFVREFSSLDDVVMVFPKGHHCMWNLSNSTTMEGIEGPTATIEEELEFIDLLIDKLATVPGIDIDKIYAAGNSNGSSLCHYIAGQREHSFIGFMTMVSGLQPGQLPLATQPAISVLQMNNRRDPYLPYEGSAYSLSAEESILAWAEHNGCDLTPQVSGVNDLLFYRYPNCRDGVVVELVSAMPIPWPNQCEQAWDIAQQSGEQFYPPNGADCGFGHVIPANFFPNGDLWQYSWDFLSGQ